MEVALPWIKILATAFTAILLLWFGFRWKAAQDWKRNGAKAAASILSLPLILLSFFLWTAQGCEDHGPLIGSPNGKHVARKLVNGSALSEDYMRVIVRRSWSPIWYEAFSGNGGDRMPMPELPEPRVQWLDNTHLVIDYPTNGVYLNICNSKAGDIVIECRTHKAVRRWE